MHGEVANAKDGEILFGRVLDFDLNITHKGGVGHQREVVRRLVVLEAVVKAPRNQLVGRVVDVVDRELVVLVAVEEERVAAQLNRFGKQGKYHFWNDRVGISH